MGDTFWISAGELSGDMHGALLLEALKKCAPTCSFIGMGGPHLREAGLEAKFRTEDLSVMGITEVVGHLPKIFSLLSGIKKELARTRPKAVIVIDAPDFHFQVIKAARRLDIPVYYYISPKIWAWRQGRVETIRQHVRRVISILPFEIDFYKQFGVDVTYVGNPLVDLVNYPSLAHIEPQHGLIGVLPGSRKREISSLMPDFGDAARRLLQRYPHLEFTCVRAPNISEDFLLTHWPADVPLSIRAPDNRWEFMRRCQMLIAASGTVTLESAIVGTPTLVTYKLSPVSYLIGKMLIKVRYASLANLIMGYDLFPELLQYNCSGAKLADAAECWLNPQSGEPLLAHIREQLGILREKLGEPGAPDRAAAYIVQDIQCI